MIGRVAFVSDVMCYTAPHAILHSLDAGRSSIRSACHSGDCHQSYLLVDLVWAVILLALAYAFVLAWHPSKKRQAIAIGFVTVAIMHAACLYFLPYHAPTTHALRAAGYNLSKGQVYEVVSNAAPGQSPWVHSSKMQVAVSAANAVVTLVAGLAGGIVGATAYRHARRE
jgi:hypothetical protein